MNKDSVLLAKLTIGRWTGRKYDKSISYKVNDEYSSNSDASRVNKMLVPKHVFKPINTAYNALYHTHNLLTLPWGDDDSRILPSIMYLRYTQQLRVCKEAYTEAADAFTSRYPQLIIDAKSWLGAMYDINDYPVTKTIRDKFYVDLYVHQLPQAKDFRVDLADDEVKRIKSNMEDRTKAATQEAMGTLWERVYNVVKRFSDTLGQVDKRFHYTMISQALELTSILPALNISNDPNLTKIQKAIEKTLTNVDTKGLREDKSYRKNTAEAADEILAKIQSYMP